MRYFAKLITLAKVGLHHPYAAYPIVALVILGPLLGRGFILTLDMVFVPHMPFPNILDSSYIVRLAIHYASLIMSADILQKLILSGIIIGSSIGMHRLALRLASLVKMPALSRPSLLFAGIFYAVNPFTYVHFMSGQYLLLMAYALLPFFIASWLDFSQSPTIKNFLQPALLLSLISWTSIHVLPIAIITAAIVSLPHLRHTLKDFKRAAMLYKWVGLSSVAYIVLNIFWIIPIIGGYGHELVTISGFSDNDRLAFSTTGHGAGQLLNLLLLRGFWGDAHNIYLLPEDIFGWWRVAMVGIAVLILSGAMYTLVKFRQGSTTILALCILGICLGAGTIGSFMAPFNTWLLVHIPFFSGFREPQKFLMITVIGYSFFGAVAIQVLFMLWKTRVQAGYYKAGLYTLACVLPFLSAPLMFYGFCGQLHARNFPKDWYAINAFLTSDNRKHANTLFLPWHLYMPFNFTETLSANPAPYFFTVPMITSDDPEFGDIHPASNRNSLQATIDSLKQHPTKDISTQLIAHNVRYILVAKDFDYNKYRGINSQPGITIMKETNNLILYKLGR